MLEGDKSDMKNDSVTESVKERECLVCVPKTESTYNNKSYEMKKNYSISARYLPTHRCFYCHKFTHYRQY